MRILHGDFNSTFKELLVKSDEITIHCSKLRKLMTEIYKCMIYTSPPVLSEFFKTKEINYGLRIKN